MTTFDTDEPSDAEYLARARSGDDDAFAALFARHHRAALRAAGQLTSPDRADDLVAEAFARIYGLLRDGRGPTVTFRAYLLAAIRRLHVDRIRQDTRHSWMGDLSVLGETFAVDDGSDVRFRSATVGRAFLGLPERWQTVLWFTAIEGMGVAEVAALLDMKPHAVSQLGVRAREGLRLQYLAEHVRQAGDERCARIVDLLPGYVRDGLSGTRRAKVDNHVAGCLRCSTAVAELAAINKDLALVVPLVLGAGSVAVDAHPHADRDPRHSLRGAALLSTAAVVLGLVIWAHERDSAPGTSLPAPATARVLRPAPLPLTPSPSSPGATPRPAPAHTPTPRPAAPPPVTSKPRPTPLLAPPTSRPAPLLEDLSLGPATAETVDPAHPQVLHTRFTVTHAVPGVVAVLVVTPAPVRFQVHAERAYGDWRCTGSSTELRCRLGRNVGDLAVDIWVTGPGVATLDLALPGVPDPVPANNHAVLRLEP
ncbi:MAG: sigma-70 family RNA polymerase sigma factor [Nocardioidaceae bacterium]|nr:sigma-70 family RNA polymerase sigma factor [Nocardioidaceae bacterium]